MFNHVIIIHPTCLFIQLLHSPMKKYFNVHKSLYRCLYSPIEPYFHLLNLLLFAFIHSWNYILFTYFSLILIVIFRIQHFNYIYVYLLSSLSLPSFTHGTTFIFIYFSPTLFAKFNIQLHSFLPTFL